MGEVAAKMKIMPESIDTDLVELKEKLKAAIPAGADLHGDIAEEPIAFGLKALILTLIVNDEEGGTEAVEEAFVKVSGVENVQILELYRI
ncbi:elongation factor 1-beta [Methanosarcina sp. 2.H.T.1A.6]|uniref:elongation factor 1-beta n=1 Tax=unclassified Methanosarcina TaxID=2644672 RepID=UPI000622598B|nr:MULTISPECIES: elongation factor 1-beta [unclassified Methanosarcina]KKG17099.1 elongation factor 1-beta [Methanosarcina sp. 2.H.T.1A.3]KKG19860.1 elongation factor 1-beta [Methanosarcina sp. 2.H.T.1A.15]KKG20279.1 elongation factor 1-beta [Methanosarcina sp. 2.H.T.1A.6]KKG23458.1 elongation factor 1-beta [Methanosarcina sp. 2.H.T.1A.8]